MFLLKILAKSATIVYTRQICLHESKSSWRSGMCHIQLCNQWPNRIRKWFGLTETHSSKYSLFYGVNEVSLESASSILLDVCNEGYTEQAPYIFKKSRTTHSSYLNLNAIPKFKSDASKWVCFITNITEDMWTTLKEWLEADYNRQLQFQKQQDCKDIAPATDEVQVFFLLVIKA